MQRTSAEQARNNRALRFSLRTTLAIAALACVFSFTNATRLRAMWEKLVATKPSLKIDNESGKVGMWGSFEDMHAHYTHSFVESEGMGMLRITTFDAPENRLLGIEGRPYAVKGVRLIGLGAEEPRVYTASWISLVRDQLEHYQSRGADEFELSALERLRLGQDLVWRQNHTSKTKLVSTNPKSKSQKLPGVQKPAHSPKSYTLVGALRAGKSCVQCHDAKPNELLGAFVYTMENDPQMLALQEQLMDLRLRNQDSLESAGDVAVPGTPSTLTETTEAEPPRQVSFRR